MEKIRELRKKKGWTQEEFGSMLGINKVTVSGYESGKRQPTPDMLSKMADLFGVSVDVILSREDPEPFGQQIKIDYEPEFTNDVIRVYEVASLRCGFGEAGAYSFSKPVEIPGSWGRRWGTNLRIIKAVGDSMSPVITPGDQLLCVPGDGWESGQIVVVDVNDSDTIKRIRRSKDGGIDLIPENPAFKPIHYTPREIDDQQIHILGRVVKVIGPDL